VDGSGERGGVAVIRGNGGREGHGISLGGEWNGRETCRGSCFVCYLHCLRIYLNSAVLTQQRREGGKGKKLDMLQDRHRQEPNATRYKLRYTTRTPSPMCANHHNLQASRYTATSPLTRLDPLSASPPTQHNHHR